MPPGTVFDDVFAYHPQDDWCMACVKKKLVCPGRVDGKTCQTCKDGKEACKPQGSNPAPATTRGGRRGGRGGSQTVRGSSSAATQGNTGSSTPGLATPAPPAARSSRPSASATGTIGRSSLTPGTLGRGSLQSGTLGRGSTTAGSSSRAGGLGRRLTSGSVGPGGVPPPITGKRRPASSTPGALSVTPSAGLSEIEEEEEEVEEEETPMPRRQPRPRRIVDSDDDDDVAPVSTPIAKKCKACRLGGVMCNGKRPCNARNCKANPNMCID
ncbi:hypothetical protein Slin14017_G086530 [Septoria linicola]|nr:hypothetical protein Slin14017_G086530 [Septoria linicola]